jgi:single-strand DNA-binding protein
MNTTTIIGRVGKDAESKTLEGGKTVANFSVAVSKKVQGNEQTTWFECALWDKTAVVPYIKKGTQIACTGEVSANAYSASDGVAKASLRLTVFQVELLGGVDKAETEKPVSASAPVAAPVTGTADDLPF